MATNDDNVGTLFGSCQVIFTDAKLLNFEQKQRRMMDIAQEMLTTFNEKKKVITSDES